MYSRKYIRPALPGQRAPVGGGEESRLPPPDYRGMAFPGEGATLARDYPETKIPPKETAPFSEEPLVEEARIPDQGEEGVAEVEEPVWPPVHEVSAPPITAEDAHDPAAEESAPDTAPRLTREEPSPPSPPLSEEAMPPLITADLLRSVTLDDLMLGWMLLMLLTCKEEEQIYLLLGLLLLSHGG